MTASLQVLSEEDQAKKISDLRNAINHNLSISHNESHVEEISDGIKKFATEILNYKSGDNLQNLLDELKQFLGMISKSRAAKIIKEMSDMFDFSNIDIKLKIEIMHSCIAWCVEENRNFLRQSLQVKLVELLFIAGEFNEAISKIQPLVSELKRIESNEQLLKLRLTESKIYMSLSGLQKARTALTNARTLSNAHFTSQLLQAELDMQSGLLNALEHKDYKTAFSYLLEAFEAFDLQSSPKAPRCLKYLITFYIMREQGGKLDKVLNDRLKVKYGSTRDILALEQVAHAANTGSLKLFYQALQENQAELVEDQSINTHLAILCDEITEKNIKKIVTPYSHVQVTHVANKINLPIPQVEQILSTMILDKQIHGVIDQNNGVLVLKKPEEPDETFSQSLAIIKELQGLVEVMNEKVRLKL